MKKLIQLFLISILFLSCVQKDNFIIGSWEIINLNSVDSSVNRTTLLNTFIPNNYSDLNLLEFSSNHTLKMKSKEGLELGSGKYSLGNNSITINFPDDPLSSIYEIRNKTDSTLLLNAFDDSETVNILLSRIQ